jgi:putative transcriptional regulator
MQPEGAFCQSCGMPLHKPEDHGTEANGSQNKKYCAYCYQTGEFWEPEMTLDEMIEISAKGWSDQDPDVSLEQARTQMKQILPHLERWRARNTILELNPTFLLVETR